MSEDRRQAKHNLCTWNYLRLKKNATKLPKTKIMNTTQNNNRGKNGLRLHQRTATMFASVKQPSDLK